MATKKSAPQKKPAKAKPAEKKPVAPKAKKPAQKADNKKTSKPVAAKKPAAKPAAKKPAADVAAKAPAEPAPAKKVPNRIPPRIVRRVPVIKPPPQPQQPAMDPAEAVAFAASIAHEMKRSAKRDDGTQDDSAIRLSRRPTTRAQGTATDKFPEADLRDFRRRLVEAREKAMSGVDAMRATGFNESDDREADGGDGTNQTLRLQALGQMGVIKRTIQQIEEALHRIEDGTYGVCTVCGQLIRKPRLINQPFVLTCMECQSEMERQRNG